MPFKTLFIRDVERNIFDWTTKITDGDIAYVIDSDKAILYVFNGSRTSMMKKYEAGVIAPKIKSVLQLYPYKIMVIDQGEGPAELKVEVEKLLQGEGTPVPEEERKNLESAIESLTSVKADNGTELAGVEMKAEAGIAVKHEDDKAKREGQEQRFKELEATNEQLMAENQVVKNENDALKKELDATKSELENKVKYLELEKEKVKLEAEAAKKDVEGTAAGLESKIKYLELEKEKARGEADAVRNELANTKAHYEEKLHALQAANEALQKDQSAARAEAASMKKENDALKRDMEEKIKKIKEENAERVKLNFFNMKALPSAPAGTVWFESIVQVIAGDKTIFTKDVDQEKLKELQKVIEKPKEMKAAAFVPAKVTAELKPDSPVAAASRVPSPAAAEPKALIPAPAASKEPSPAVIAAKKAVEAAGLSKVASPAVAASNTPLPVAVEPKAENPKEEDLELDFVNIEKEDQMREERRKKGDIFDFPDMEK
nr:hypothetical protein [Candidatus Sigynarchaeum springense]